MRSDLKKTRLLHLGMSENQLNRNFLRNGRLRVKFLKTLQVTIPERVSVFESFGNNCSETSSLQINGTMNYTDSKFFDTVYHPHYDYFGKIDYWEDTEKSIFYFDY